MGTGPVKQPTTEPNVNPSGKPPLSGETLGIPNSVHIPIPSILQTLGIAPMDPACQFVQCGTTGNALDGAAIAIDWCAGNPKPCSTVIAFASDVLSTISAAALVLSLTGDNEDPDRCNKIRKWAIEVCSEEVVGKGYGPERASEVCKKAHGERRVFLLTMIKEKRLASLINDQVRDICRRLDESAALVRIETPEEGHRYAIAVAKVFDIMNTEIFEPLYKEHPDIAPPGWND